ncbi:MAG: cell division ATP-binding protein FtsE [Pseudomonadota bacterium]
MVQFNQVGLRYDDQPETLSDVSMTVREGDFRFLTGPSGAGKTSLLRLIYLAQRPTRGLITLFGRDVTAAPRGELPPLRRRVGVVFQDFRLLDHLTAFENVALPLKIAGVNPKRYREDVMELLTWVGLGDRMEAKPPTLSGGEKQRVAIARAVVAKPDLIIADEPTGNVDPEMGARIMRLFLELNKLGAAVLIATHDHGLVQRFKKPLFRLQSGRLSAHVPKPQERAPFYPRAAEGGAA